MTSAKGIRSLACKNGLHRSRFGGSGQKAAECSWIRHVGRRSMHNVTMHNFKQTAHYIYVSAISTNHNVTPEPPIFPLTFLVALRHNDTAGPISELECLKQEETPLPRLWKLPIFTCQNFGEIRKLENDVMRDFETGHKNSNYISKEFTSLET